MGKSDEQKLRGLFPVKLVGRLELINHFKKIKNTVDEQLCDYNGGWYW